MRIDEFDRTLVLEQDDTNIILTYWKEDHTLPKHVEESIVKIILDRLRVEFPENCTLDELLRLLPSEFLSKTVQVLNQMYISNQVVNYQDRHYAYLMYYLPANVFKIWRPLMDLQVGNNLKAECRVLDVGTGPGSVAVGICLYFGLLAESYPDIQFALEFTLLDAEGTFLDIAQDMLTRTAQALPHNLSVRISSVHQVVLGTEELPELDRYDIITFSNFFTSNERQDIRGAYLILEKFKSNLVQDGSIVIIEPGAQTECIRMKNLRNAAVNKGLYNVYSPCLGVWEPKDVYNCACFGMVRSHWNLPQIYEFLVAQGLNKANRPNVPFNYVILRQDGLRKYAPFQRQHFVPLCDLEHYVGKRVNVRAILRTVIYRPNSIHLALCDGSCAIQSDDEAFWVQTTDEVLKKHGIQSRLVAGECITLKKVTVPHEGQGRRLQIDKDTRIEIAY
jgi:SAM-dependent methyltransferase